MTSSITPVTIFPGTATKLRVHEGYSGQIGGAPYFQYELLAEDDSVLKSAGSQLTQEQWNGWTDAEPDGDYVLACIAANIGVTLAQ